MNPDEEHAEYFKKNQPHSTPSPETKRMFDSVENKFSHLEKHFDTQMSEMKTTIVDIDKKLDKKADKSWTWTIIVTLISIITIIMGAQYTETKRLNENITDLLVGKGATDIKIENIQKEIGNIQSFIYNLERE